jgi:hypothetical protein
MPTRDEIDEALSDAISEPKSASDDAGRSVTNHSLKELADLRDRVAPTSGRGLRFTKLIPPGAG